MPGRYVVSYDGYTYSGPNLVVTEAAARRWTLALWNDAAFGGVSHLGNPQAGTLYPPRVMAVLLFETNRAMGVVVAVHVVLLGLGFVVLARRLGVGAGAAAFGGCVAVLSGMTLTKATQFEQIVVIAWMPWLVVAVHATLRGDRPWRAVAVVAAVTAAMLTAGHPQMTFMGVILGVAAAIGLLADWRRLGHLAIGLALGAAIAAPQVVAAAIATGASAITGGRSDAQLLDPLYAATPRSAIRALLGSVTADDPVAFTGGFEAISFVGVIVACLAAVGLVDGLARPDRRRLTVALALCAAVSAIWALGPRTWLFDAAHLLVPGFDLGRVSSRWLILTVFVLVVLAMLGLDTVVRGAVTGRRAVVTAGAIGGGLLLVVAARAAGATVVAQWIVLAGLAVAAVAAASTGNLAVRRAAAAVLVIGAIAELGLMARHSVPERAATDTPFTSSTYRSATTVWLQGRPGYVVSLTDDGRGPEYSVPGLRPNAHVLAGVRSVDGYDGGVQITERWAAALERLRPDPDLDLPLRNALPAPLDPVILGRLGVHYVLLDRRRPAVELVPSWTGPVVSDEQFAVYENPAWRGESVAWPSARVVATDEMPEQLRTQATVLADVLLVDDDDAALSCTTACAPVGLAVERHTPEHATTTVDLATPAIVTLDQQADPGWHVEVDGRRAPLVVADGFVLGVRVDAGRHVVEWRYRPWWLSTTLAISVSALLATIALGTGTIAAVARRVRRVRDAR